jgi:hypothetical protein
MNFDEWNDVVAQERLPMWNPSSYTEDGQTYPKKVSDESYVIGYYIGMKVIPSKKQGEKDMIKHELQLEKVGNKDDLSKKEDGSEATKGDRIELWGKTVIDEALTKNVAQGQMVAIIWKGKSKTKDGKRSYQNYEIKTRDKFLEGIAPAIQKEEKPAPAKEPFDDLDEEDDLDF